MSDRPSLLDELKRRKVVRVALVYGATVFAVLQVADILVDPLALPPWTMRVLVVLAAVLFPVALVLAWAFELSPDGVTRTAPSRRAGPTDASGEAGGSGSGAAGPESTQSTSLISKRTVVAVGVLVAVGFGAGWFFAPGAASDTEGPMLLVSEELRPQGIAVLPFTSRSESAESAEFFAAGLHDDLLTRLAAVEGLVVISRTSVEQYRDTEKSIPRIGRELSVAYVLEGGVQRAGERLRVNAQLIDARTDEHVWAETLDGDLAMADIFAIQTDLAERIVQAMTAELPGSRGLAAGELPTESVEAWEAYSRGRIARSRVQLAEAEGDLMDAVRLDPEFASAWAQLSMVRSSLHWFGSDRATLSKEALDRALVMAPEAPETLQALAFFEYYVLMAYRSAEVSARRAVAAAPGEPDPRFTLGLILRRVGDLPGGVEEIRQAASLGPQNADYASALAEALWYRRDEAAFDQVVTRMMQMEGVDPFSIQLATWAPLGTGAMAVARRVHEQAPPQLASNWAFRLSGLWLDLYDPDQPDPDPSEIRAILEAAEWTSGPSRVYIETASQLTGAGFDEAHIRWLAGALDELVAISGGAQQNAIWRSIRAAVHALEGEEQAALEDVESVVAWVRRTGDQTVTGPLLYSCAVAMELLGDREAAVRYFEESAPSFAFRGAFALRDPLARDGLATDPRVQRLVEAWAAPEGDLDGDR